MSPQRPIPGPRDVRATLDGGEDLDAAVVACPPHPQYGGDRSDRRLRAVGDALGERGIACLRIDYGAYDAGPGEVADAGRACAWARERFDAVGLFGYSFGAGVALSAAAADADPAALAVLAPPATVGDLTDRQATVDDLSVPALFVVGERDDTVDWRAVAERATAAGHRIERVPGDHFFAGQHDEIGSLVAAFFDDVLAESPRS